MYSIIKRLSDFASSTVAILILSPLLIPILIGLKLTGEGYIFYKQKRIGLKNKYFNILKFATMLKDSPNMGTGSITLREDPRITPMGGFLRKTKINELPQIFNVLKGEMSIVGPRPLVDRTFNAYPNDIQKVVYNSKPGITGIGSIVFRDEEKEISEATIPPHDYYAQFIAPYKGALEMWYQNNKSFYTDFMLIFLTAWAIIVPESDLVYKVFSDLPVRQNVEIQAV
jgi:lipopolysaccharide/colanic/teichoic acid biosynthesis glycosyltransferase